MKSSVKIGIVFAIAMLIVLGVLGYLHINRKSDPRGTPMGYGGALEHRTPQYTGEDSQSSVVEAAREVQRSLAESMPSTRIIPTFGLDELLDDFTDDLATKIEDQANLEILRRDHIRYRDEGGKIWYKQEEWMKEPEYYKALDTVELAKECFDNNGLVGFEMGLTDTLDPAFIRLEIHHNGFAELFKREDMWKGLLDTYYYLGKEIDPELSLRRMLMAVLSLDGLNKFYHYRPFKTQLKGREKEFLAASVYILRKMDTYLKTYDPARLGLEEDDMPFSCEAASIVNTSLLLLREVDSNSFSQVKPVLASVEWSEQNLSNLKQYLDLSVRLLDRSESP